METKFLYEDDGEKLVIQNTQDISPIIQEVEKLRDFGGKGKDMWHLGRIPEIIVEQYCNSVGITFREFMLDNTHINRIMNDADYKHFRVLG
jgi:hypothetical protein